MDKYRIEYKKFLYERDKDNYADERLLRIASLSSNDLEDLHIQIFNICMKIHKSNRVFPKDGPLDFTYCDSYEDHYSLSFGPIITESLPIDESKLNKLYNELYK